MPFQRRVRRSRRGGYDVRLSPAERNVLRSLPSQLRDLLGTDDPSLRRLFPPAYTDDPERDADYQHLMREDLLARHRDSLETLEATVDATHVDEDQLLSWLGALNQLRLVLGTRLDVSEELRDPDPSDPDAAALTLYAYLGFLQEQVVEALSG